MKTINSRTNQQPVVATFAFTMLALFMLTGGAARPLQAQTAAAEKQTPAVTHTTVSHNTWSSGAAMPTAVVAPEGVAVLKDEIYVLGGVNSAGTTIADTQIYNPATNSWSTGVPLPMALTDGAAAVVKNVLYVIAGGSSIMSGTTPSNAVWAYNAKTMTWSSKAAIPTARQSVGVVVEGNIIYVIGGVADNNRLTTVESYDPATDAWTEEAPLLVGKSEPSAGLVGKTIVAADGFTISQWTGDNEGYDAATNTWTSLTSDPTARNAACAGGIGARLYVAGGGNGSGNAALTLTESFQVSKNKWTTLAPLPQSVWLAGATVYNKQLYCIGGANAQNEGTVLNNVQIYQP